MDWSNFLRGGGALRPRVPGARKAADAEGDRGRAEEFRRLPRLLRVLRVLRRLLMPKGTEAAPKSSKGSRGRSECSGCSDEAPGALGVSWYPRVFRLWRMGELEGASGCGEAEGSDLREGGQP